MSGIEAARRGNCHKRCCWTVSAVPNYMPARVLADIALCSVVLHTGPLTVLRSKTDPEPEGGFQCGLRAAMEVTCRCKQENGRR